MQTQPAKYPSSRPLESYLAPLESLLQQLIRAGGFELAFTVRRTPSGPKTGEADFESPEVIVDFSGPDSDLLLQANAELLNALEYVVLRALRLEEDLFGKIAFDCQDWRRLRVEELKLMARVAAEGVAETGTPRALDPMSPRERRIIHLALKDQPAVRTVSEGFATERRVIIHPAK
jgi:spoIIIJ-associated protein